LIESFFFFFEIDIVEKRRNWVLCPFCLGLVEESKGHWLLHGLTYTVVFCANQPHRHS